MKRSIVLFFQTVVIVLGLGALAFLLIEPHFEGRNVNATFFEIYFKDAFLLYAYASSITFFIGLYKVFRVLENAKKGKFFSLDTANTLRAIKHCALVASGLVVGGVIILLITESDDRPPIIAMGTIIILASVVVVVISARYERIVKTVLRF